MKGKKLLIIVTGVVVLGIIGTTVLSKTGLVENGTTYGGTEIKQGQTSIDKLKDGCFYVWENGNEKNIEDNDNSFILCPEGTKNISYDDKDVSMAKFTVWIDDATDNSIPTLTSKDKLIFVNQTLVPDTFDFLRMYENGYSIGVTSLTPDASDHYYLTYIQADKDDYKQFVNVKSDAKDLGGLAVEKLYLEKVGDMDLTDETVSEGGVVTGLKKDEKYICEFYTGTYFQDYLLTASNHTFTTFEDFTCYGYKFLHSNCISIDIPDWLATGYYYINGIGLFRYVSDEDLANYNGEAYDANIAWNEPLIIYDEFGRVAYDPSDISLQDEVDGTVDEANAGTVTEATAANDKGLARWSYTLDSDMESFSAEITLSDLANSNGAVLSVKLPNDKVKQFKEMNGVIAVQLDNIPAGTYAFNLAGITGRTFEVNYSTGDTYSGSGMEEEPDGDDTLDPGSEELDDETAN